MTTTDELDARLTALQTGMVAQLADIKAKVDALGTPEERDDTPLPQRWVDRATHDDWQTLVDWVDDLNRSYSLTSNYRIHPCWPMHPGVIEELAAVHHAWIAATISDAKHGPHPAEPAEGKKPEKPARPAKGGQEYAHWHTYVLWPFLNRLSENRYRIHMCKTGHTSESTNVPDPTDRATIPNRTTVVSHP